jgi:hypothetical protein
LTAALRERHRDWEIDACPLADGGEGFSEILTAAARGQVIGSSVTGPREDEVQASIYRQEIPPGSRSGRLKFQGGKVMFIVAGRGYTLIDGVKHAWEAGDILNLPLKRDGIIIQHVNDDAEKTAAFLAVEPNLFAATSVDRGAGFEQMETSPDYKRPG